MTDIVCQISRCHGASCRTAALVMTRDVVLCRPGDLLHDVWVRMKGRGLKNLPVADQDLGPLGVLNAPAADVVTDSNGEDGFANAIERFILGADCSNAQGGIARAGVRAW